MKNSEIQELVDGTVGKITGQLSNELRAAETGATTIKLLAEIALRLHDKDSAFEEAQTYFRNGKNVEQTTSEVETITLPEGLTITEDVLNKTKDATTNKGKKK